MQKFDQKIFFFVFIFAIDPYFWHFVVCIRFVTVVFVPQCDVAEMKNVNQF